MERISPDTPNTEGHRLRYHLAAGFLKPRDVVLDAACGCGYGADILTARRNIRYIGVDKSLDYVIPQPGGRYFAVDLVAPDIPFEFDVFVGFGTVEHLADYTEYVKLARRARRVMLVSAPIVPTVGINPFHLHDFVHGDLAGLFAGDGWTVFGTFDQPVETDEVVILVKL